MILRNIEFDLKYQKNHQYIEMVQQEQGLSYDEAIKLDYENHWKEKRHLFKKMTRCMTSMIEQNMGKIQTKDCWKLIFSCENRPEKSSVINLLGAYEIPFMFDDEMFMAATNYERKKLIIDAILCWVQNPPNELDFDLSSIGDACKKIIQKNYEDSFIWGKSIKKKHREVQIEIIHDVEHAKLFMILLENNKILFKKFIVETEPHEIVYNNYLGTLEWTGDSSVALVTTDGKRIQIDYSKELLLANRIK